MDILVELFQNLDIDVVDFIDIRLTFGLIGLGFCIKHLYFLKKVSNEHIPAILVATSLLISYATLDVFTKHTIINTFINSILTSAVAIGIHQQCKGFLKPFKEVAVGVFKKSIEEDDMVD